MKDPTLQRIGADPALIKRALFLSNTAAESPRRTLAVMGNARYGRKGTPKVLLDQMYADYLRLGSIAAIAPIYGRSPQSVWETLHNHGYELKPCSKQRLKPGTVVFEGVTYSLSGKNQQMRATTGARGLLRRAVWEKAHGPLRRGSVVIPRDGNPLNCALENLIAGTKEEIMRQLNLQRFGRAGMTVEEQRARNKKIALDRYYRLREEYRQQGLRCDGRELRRRVLTPEERAEKKRALNLGKWQRRAERLTAAGKTTRGTAPVYRPRKQLTPMQSAYAALKAEIEQGGPRELPVACGFRDTELNARSQASGRANKGNFAGFNLKEAA